MKALLQPSLLLVLLFAAQLVCPAQVYSVRPLGTIWELSPEERKPFMADHSGSVCGIQYMHTPVGGWIVIAGRRSFTVPRRLSVPSAVVVLSVGVLVGLTWMMTGRESLSQA